MYTVLESHRLPHDPTGTSVDAEIILCHLPHNLVTPYATWQRNVADGSRYWGHYFKEIGEAVTDYNQRIAQ